MSEMQRCLQAQKWWQWNLSLSCNVDVHLYTYMTIYRINTKCLYALHMKKGCEAYTCCSVLIHTITSTRWTSSDQRVVKRRQGNATCWLLRCQNLWIGACHCPRHCNHNNQYSSSSKWHNFKFWTSENTFSYILVTVTLRGLKIGLLCI